MSGTGTGDDFGFLGHQKPLGIQTKYWNLAAITWESSKVDFILGLQRWESLKLPRGTHSCKFCLNE